MALPPIDFARIAQAALGAAERLVPGWLPNGRRAGHEWQAPNPTRHDRHVGSFSVNLTTGAWADFATDDKGGDLVSLYAYLFTGGNQIEAAKAVAELLGIVEHDPKPASSAPTKKRSSWTPIIPVPPGAHEPPVAHVKRGRPRRTWCYRDQSGAALGHVYRFETSDGGKDLIPLVWARNDDTGELAWRWMQWAEPRPLYGLDRLRHGKTVLIVEREKCADAGHEALGEWLDVLSWPGGANAVGKADWSPLTGRRIVIWPDCDAQLHKQTQQMLPEHKQPGTVTAERIARLLTEQGCEVRIVKIPAPGARPSGWDIADAIEAGASAADLQAMLRDLRPPRAEDDPDAGPPPDEPGDPGPEPAARSAARAGGKKRGAREGWEAGLLERRGEVVACLANVTMILSSHADWQGVVAFDEFSQRTIKLAALPCAGSTSSGPEWTDVDTSRTIIWLTQHYRITASAADVDQAIELVAHSNAFHPVRRYLEALAPWDGIDRCDEWLADFMGVARSSYTAKVGRWFLMGMVARVMRPGCKFDYALVLEGTQGRRKSSALRVLGGEWFSDTELDLSNKDSMSAIRGKWLHEFAELGSLARAESTRQKSFLTRQIDEFRPTYGRREIRCPRQLVFAGSTNEWAWNKDLTGGRRFWPVEVTQEIDTDGLAAVRDQLFAEALSRFKAGERYWPTADEQRDLFDPEQLRREAEDSFLDPVHDWIEGLARTEFTLHDVLADALRLDAGRQTRDVMTRVGLLLKKLGCQRREKRNGVSRFVYRVPDWAPISIAETTRHAAADVGHRDGAMPL
ncbi:MAG TPA: VapE family protein [Burkholderiaceae bacterium]|nr:VapE family protein [Burkholderiaceae bacterium]